MSTSQPPQGKVNTGTRGPLPLTPPGLDLTPKIAYKDDTINAAFMDYNVYLAGTLAERGVTTRPKGYYRLLSFLPALACLAALASAFLFLSFAKSCLSRAALAPLLALDSARAASACILFPALFMLTCDIARSCAEAAFLALRSALRAIGMCRRHVSINVAACYRTERTRGWVRRPLAYWGGRSATISVLGLNGEKKMKRAGSCHWLSCSEFSLE